MLKRTLLKGTVVLAASAAAALSACGTSGTNDDGGGEGGLGGSSTGGSSSGGATTGGSSSGGTETGGNSNPGGSSNGGEGGEGGAPPVLETAQDYVDYYCPEGTSAYTITEGDETANSYGEFSVPSPTAFVTWGEDDMVYATYDSNESATRHPLCIIGGTGDDYVQVGGSSYGTTPEGYTGGYTPTVTFVGGAGADLVEYTATTSDNWGAYYRPPFVFKDFESGVDQIRFNPSYADVDPTYDTDGVAFISNFDEDSTSAEYSSYTYWAVVVDPVDGEIWFSANNEGTQINFLVGIVEGDELEEGDVIVEAPPI